MKNIALYPFLAGFSLFLVGCNSTNQAVQAIEHPDRSLILAKADHLPIIQTRVKQSTDGSRVTPGFITCVAPSPDVATALTKTFQISAGASANLPSDVTPEVAFAVSRAQSQSVAQLGERIATIQLLRDGLYRACEAYANGAISEITYAVMLSRYDDTMVTLLATDLAAGAFGRSLAGIGGQASGAAKSTADYSEKVEQRLEAEKKLEQAISQKFQHDQTVNELVDSQNNQEANLEKAIAEGASGDTVEALKTSLEQTENSLEVLENQSSEYEKQLNDAKREAISKKTAEVNSSVSGSVTVAGSITPGQQNTEVAKTIHDIQRKYIENVNDDALMTACITAMSQPGNVLAAKCEAIVDSLLRTSKEKFQIIKDHSAAEKDRLKKYATYKTVIDELLELQKQTNRLTVKSD